MMQSLTDDNAAVAGGISDGGEDAGIRDVSSDVTANTEGILGAVTHFLNDTNSSVEIASTEVTERTFVQAIFITFYCIIFLLGVSGNVLVVYVVLRNKSMQSITNIFITNLAVSDIMMCLLAVPFTPVSAFIKSWVFGDALCHMVPMALGVSVYVSTLTSAAIAIDRYFVIVHPFKPRMKIFICILLIIAIWIISMSISLPLAIYQVVKWKEDLQVYVCMEHWPKATARQFFTVTNLILQYVVPCCIISFCYIMVSLVLKARAKTKIGSRSCNSEREELEIKRKRRTNKMLIAMVSIFVFCWMPLNSVLIYSEYDPKFVEWQYFGVTFFVAHVVAMSSTIYNPFLYAGMNENFKKEFKTVVPFLFSRSRHSNMNGLVTQYTTVETQSVLQRSPQSQRNNQDNGNNVASIREPKAVYDNDMEKVSLKVAGADEEC